MAREGYLAIFWCFLRGGDFLAIAINVSRGGEPCVKFLGGNPAEFSRSNISASWYLPTHMIKSK